MTISPVHVLVLTGAVLATGATGVTIPDDSFAARMDRSMEQMHRGMHVELTGDPDRDFARMMIPHHQGAVDMALVELRYGHDERLRRLAEGIIVEQKQEIEVMHHYLATPPPRAVVR